MDLNKYCCGRPFVITTEVIWGQPTYTEPSFLLQENNDFLLQENNDKIIL